MVDYDTSLKKVGSVGDVLEVQRTPRQSGLSSVLERLTKFVGTDIPAQEKENAASQKRESDSYNLCRQNGGSPQECESKVRSNRVGGFLGKILGRDDFQAPSGTDKFAREQETAALKAKKTTAEIAELESEEKKNIASAGSGGLSAHQRQSNQIEKQRAIKTIESNISSDGLEFDSRKEAEAYVIKNFKVNPSDPEIQMALDEAFPTAKIKVKRKSDGAVGTIDESDFNPSLYKKV